MLSKNVLEIVLLITQILILFALILYVIKTWRIASVTRSAADMFALSLQVMKETRDMEIAPYVIALFEVSNEEQNVYLVIKNIGKSTAKDVRIQFDPGLIGSADEAINRLPVVKDGITMLPPNHEIRLYVDSALSFFFEKNERPLIYKATITFYGGLEETQKGFEQVLDLTSQQKISKIAQNNIKKLDAEIGKLSTTIERMIKEIALLNENLTGGVRIRNQITEGPLHNDEDSWIRIISSKLSEFKNLWSTLYGGNREKLFHPFLGKLKNRLSYITDQLLATISLSPPDTTDEIKNQLLDIVARLADLNSIRVYPDGPQSVLRFNSSGDKTLGFIEEMIKKIEIISKKIE